MTSRFFTASRLLPGVAALLLTACEKPQVSVYLAPKDEPAPPGSPGHVHDPNDPNDRHDDEPASQPQQAKSAAPRPKPGVTYQLPEGWTETAPGDVSVAAFSIKADGAEATANITPLPDLRGREAMVVNMYRQQTGQPPIEQADIDKTLERVDVGGTSGQLLELVGKAKDKPVRLITVIQHLDGRSWFYRLSGDEALVARLKDGFLAFIKTVKVKEPATATQQPADPATPPPASAPAPGSAAAPSAPETKPQP